MTSTGASMRAYRAALALALGAAVSLGLARFSYALLLPPMRADLQWSYFTAGAMNTVNAAGYLVGALLAPRWLARHDARHVLLAGMGAAAVLLAAHALAPGDVALFALRAATGVASAATFVSGGLLAARLGAMSGAGVTPTSTPGVGPSAGLVAVPAGLAVGPGVRSSLILGLYYGGTGAGIVASALLVPSAASIAAWFATPPVPWRTAWVLLGSVAAIAAVVALRGTRGLGAAPPASASRGLFDWKVLRFGLAAYLMFGLGYIGYMTFVVTLLREGGLDASTITAFYVVLGLGVMASPWLWAGLLQRHRGGVPIAVLNGLLAVATVLPVIDHHPAVVFASGALFGGVFLSVVASTTAMVRHNLEPAAWPVGIAAFTIVFAAGQIVGPGLVGWIADTGAGLAKGFVASAVLLALGSALGWMQRPLPRQE